MPPFYESVYNGSYFIGWGTLSLINANLAQGKNRSGLTWFLLSLLLGPIAPYCSLKIRNWIGTKPLR